MPWGRKSTSAMESDLHLFAGTESGDRAMHLESGPVILVFYVDRPEVVTDRSCQQSVRVEILP
jgi:hypothetical protein